MNRIKGGVAASVALLALGAGAQAAKTSCDMTFFVTSTGLGKGADLVMGADYFSDSQSNMGCDHCRFQIRCRLLQVVFSAFKSAFEGDGYSFGQKLCQAWDVLWNAIKTVLSTAPTNIKNAFKNVDWGAVGRGIIDGIVAGIRNAAQRLVAAAIAAARAALDAVKGFLGLSSPSVVFKGVGINMMKGMAEGVKVSAGLPVSAVTVAAQRTIPRASGSGMVGGGLFIGDA